MTPIELVDQALKGKTWDDAEEYFKKILAEHGFPTDIEFVDYIDLETIINKEIRWK